MLVSAGAALPDLAGTHFGRGKLDATARSVLSFYPSTSVHPDVHVAVHYL